MRLSVSHSALKECISLAERLCKAKDFPVLQNLRLTAGDNLLRIEATDLNTAYRCQISAEVDEPGDYLCPAKILKDLVSELPEMPVGLRVKDYHLNLSSEGGNFRGRIALLEASDYPSIAGLEDATPLTIPAQDLARICSQVAFAVSNDATRLSLAGIYLHPMRAHLEAAATDGHRLGWLSLPASRRETEVGPDTGWIVQASTLSLVHQLAVGDQEIKTRVASGAIEFDLGSIQIIGKLIDGPYPAYKSIYSPKTTWRLDLQRDQLGPALRRILALQHGCKERSVRLTPAEGRVAIYARGNGTEGKDDLTPSAMEGEIPPFSVNAEYLLDLIGRIGSPTICIAGTGPTNALVLTAESPETKDKARWILMPRRDSEMENG